MSKKIRIFFFASFLASFNSYAQSKPRKFTTSKEVLARIAEKKVNELSKDITLTPIQRKRIKGFYYKEASMIDSLKYMPADYFTYPDAAHERIINIKRYTEEQVKSILSEEQYATLEKRREIKRQKAIQKLNEESLKKAAKK